MPTQNVLGVGGCHLPSQSCTSPSHLATTLHRFVSLFARDWVMIVGSLQPAIFILATGWYKRRSSLWDHGKLNLSDIRVGRKASTCCLRSLVPPFALDPWLGGSLLFVVCFSSFVLFHSPKFSFLGAVKPLLQSSPGLEGSVEVCTVII